MCDDVETVDDIYESFENFLKIDQRNYTNGYRFLIWIDDCMYYYLVFTDEKWRREILPYSIGCHGLSNRVTEGLYKQNQTREKEKSYLE